MFLELHILQNFAPSNLNRDDTGAPKDCEFGGYRRARISSQCLKRAIRTCFDEMSLLPKEMRAARTKRLAEALIKRLEAADKDPAKSRDVVAAALGGMGLALEPNGKTQYLLFLGEREVAALAEQCAKHWDALAAIASDPKAGNATANTGGGKDAKKSGKAAVPGEVNRALEAVLDGGRAADLALFGRMLADLPSKNVHAASQVAHAISTNKANIEFDFYTAVDDLKPDDTAGADMLGTVEFNSACFYRYANLDLDQLRTNLSDNEDLARRTVDAFLRAAVEAVPTGKQNSMAAQNPPSFVMAVARQRGLWSLSNAFLRPVRADGSGDLMQNSIAALDRYWAQLTKMYGERGIVGKWWTALEGDGLVNLKSDKRASVEALYAEVASVLRFETIGGGNL